ELSQPQIRCAAPCRSAPPCQAAGPCQKPSSYCNVNITKVRSKIFGGMGVGVAPTPVTTVVPSFAVATIPIAVQTTRFAAATGAEFGLFGAAAGRRESEFSRTDIEDMVRREGGLQQRAAGLARGGA